MSLAEYEASLELARKIAKRAAMATAGVTDPFEDHRQTQIAQHLDEFIASLKSAKRAPRYVLQVGNRIKRIIAGLGVKFLHELDPVAVDRFLADLASKEKHSGITRNEYVASIKSLTKWAVTYRRMRDDVLAGLNRVSPRAAQALMRHTDPRLLALSEAEGTAGVYTDEKLLPLAAELLNVPSIPMAQSAAPSAAELPAELDLQSLVAGLTASQKQALVQMLSRSLAS